MTTKHLLDPELLPLLDAMPALQFNAEMLVEFRQAINDSVTLADTDAAGVRREEIYVPVDGGPDVRCLLYVPTTAATNKPAYLHLHGGGFIVGSADASDHNNVALSAKLGIVILSVDYRLAPEHSVPCQLDDAYAALVWLHENSEALSIDRSRIAVGGESAGGGVAASLAIFARHTDYSICHQHLTYPMLDDRTGSPECRADPLVGEFIWSRKNNAYGWGSYLGEQTPVSPYVPARLDDFAGLPSSWIATASHDLFRDEDIQYATQILGAGGAAELIVYPGACHGFPLLPDTVLEKRYTRDHREALALALCIVE